MAADRGRFHLHARRLARLPFARLLSRSPRRRIFSDPLLLRTPAAAARRGGGRRLPALDRRIVPASAPSRAPRQAAGVAPFGPLAVYRRMSFPRAPAGSSRTGAETAPRSAALRPTTSPRAASRRASGITRRSISPSRRRAGGSPRRRSARSSSAIGASCTSRPASIRRRSGRSRASRRGACSTSPRRTDAAVRRDGFDDQQPQGLCAAAPGARSFRPDTVGARRGRGRVRRRDRCSKGRRGPAAHSRRQDCRREAPGTALRRGRRAGGAVHRGQSAQRRPRGALRAAPRWWRSPPAAFPTRSSINATASWFRSATRTRWPTASHGPSTRCASPRSTPPPAPPHRAGSTSPDVRAPIATCSPRSSLRARRSAATSRRNRTRGDRVIAARTAAHARRKGRPQGAENERDAPLPCLVSNIVPHL